MDNRDPLQLIKEELAAGMQLTKCRQCGCMQATLNSLAEALPPIDNATADQLSQKVKEWRRQMGPVRYACLGCEHCYPAVVQNALSDGLPALEVGPGLDCNLQLRAGGWPPVVGEYFVLERTAPVAVSTLSSMS
jgi:tetrahydromethanopterin S-methyltransferase subunit A